MKMWIALIAPMVAVQAEAATIITKNFVLPEKSLNYININVGKNQLADFSVFANAIGGWCTNGDIRNGNPPRCFSDRPMKSAWCDEQGCTAAFAFSNHWLEIPRLRLDDDVLQLRVASFLDHTSYDGGRWWAYFVGPTKVEVQLKLKDGIDPASVNMDLQFLRTMPAVPEPQSWAMLIVGFGIIGLAARLRRQTVMARQTI